MDLPTYTSIWRIEKRLYKLYDFNLPVPLPMVQVGVFVGVFAVWVVFLQLIRVPFHQPFHVLYLVPPGVLTFLATRPVLEGKRLTELLLSQVRYLTEPRTWCRLAPVREPDRVTMVGTVWRRQVRPPSTPERHARRRLRDESLPRPRQIERVPPGLAQAGISGPGFAAPVSRATPAGGAFPVGSTNPAIPASSSSPADVAASAASGVSGDAGSVAASPAGPAGPVSSATATGPASADAGPAGAAEASPVDSAGPASAAGAVEAVDGGPASPASPDRQPAPEYVPDESERQEEHGEQQERVEPRERSEHRETDATPDASPELDAPAAQPPSPPAQAQPSRPQGARTQPTSPPAPARPSVDPSRPAWRRFTAAVAGTHARQPSVDAHEVSAMMTGTGANFRGTRRILVLGCGDGAGQTVSTIMLGHTLARHRRDRCVAVDASPGRRSMTRRSRTESPETFSSLLDRIDFINGYLGLRAYTSQAGSGLEVIGSDEDADLLSSVETKDFRAAVALLDRFYKVSLMDPAKSLAERVLPLADQLVLVVSSTADARGALAGALEWLERQGQGRLVSSAVVVVNGVRKDNAPQAEQVELAVARRCGGTVRIPWDGRLNPKGGIPAEPDSLHPATRHAYLRLASTLVAGFSAVPDRYRQEVSG